MTTKRGPGRPPRSDERTVNISFTVSAEDARWLRETFKAGTRSAWLAEQIAKSRANGSLDGASAPTTPGDTAS